MKQRPSSQRGKKVGRNLPRVNPYGSPASVSKQVARLLPNTLDAYWKTVDWIGGGQDLNEISKVIREKLSKQIIQPTINHYAGKDTMRTLARNIYDNENKFIDPPWEQCTSATRDSYLQKAMQEIMERKRVEGVIDRRARTLYDKEVLKNSLPSSLDPSWEECSGQVQEQFLDTIRKRMLAEVKRSGELLKSAQGYYNLDRKRKDGFTNWEESGEATQERYLKKASEVKRAQLENELSKVDVAARIKAIWRKESQ